jgi:hypothetical protein
MALASARRLGLSRPKDVIGRQLEQRRQVLGVLARASFAGVAFPLVIADPNTGQYADDRY